MNAIKADFESYFSWDKKGIEGHGHLWLGYTMVHIDYDYREGWIVSANGERIKLEKIVLNTKGEAIQFIYQLKQMLYEKD